MPDRVGRTQVMLDMTLIRDIPWTYLTHNSVVACPLVCPLICSWQMSRPFDDSRAHQLQYIVRSPMQLQLILGGRPICAVLPVVKG